METIEIIEKINKNLDYLQKRKELLFGQIQQLKQRLDNVSSDISEQETYIQLESSREKLESNIFSLYDTTYKHTLEKEHLSSVLEGKFLLKKQVEEALEELLSEMDIVNEHIVSNQILVKHFSVMEEKTNTEIEIENKKKLDITNRLELCIGTLELDKERCAMELQKLLDDVKAFSI